MLHRLHLRLQSTHYDTSCIPYCEVGSIIISKNDETMKLRLFFILTLPIVVDAFFASFFEWLFPRAEPFELTERLLLLSVLAGNVTFLSFLSEERGLQLQAEGDYDFYRFFNAEPSQAVVAASNNYCFVGFRGTTLDDPIVFVQDLLVNLLPGFDSVCGSTPAAGAGGGGEEDEVCCDVRTPYNLEYNAAYRQELEDAVQECLDTHATPCEDEHGCLVLTGFSQGAGIAAVASLYLAEHNPYVITFGEPATLGKKKECALARTDKWFRYVNTWNNYLFTGSIGYDFVSVFPFSLDTRQVGHMIVFPSKQPFDNTTSTGLAYLGLNPDEAVWQLNPLSLEAHDIVESSGESFEFHPGYLNHLTFLWNSRETIEFPWVLDGFADGYLCSLDRECKSGRCQWQFLGPKVCMGAG